RVVLVVDQLPGQRVGHTAADQEPGTVGGPHWVAMVPRGRGDLPDGSGWVGWCRQWFGPLPQVRGASSIVGVGAGRIWGGREMGHNRRIRGVRRAWDSSHEHLLRTVQIEPYAVVPVTEAGDVTRRLGPRPDVLDGAVPALGRDSCGVGDPG